MLLVEKNSRTDGKIYTKSPDIELTWAKNDVLKKYKKGYLKNSIGKRKNRPKPVVPKGGILFDP